MSGDVIEPYVSYRRWNPDIYGEVYGVRRCNLCELAILCGYCEIDLGNYRRGCSRCGGPLAGASDRRMWCCRCGQPDAMSPTPTPREEREW